MTDVRPIRCLLCGAVVAYRVSTASKRELRTVRPCRIESAVVDVGFCEPRCGTLADDAA